MKLEKMNMMPLKKILLNPVQLGLTLFLLGSSLSAFADEKSVDSKTKKAFSMEKCGTGKCGALSKEPKAGMSHASKCGTSNDKCSGGKSHGSKCGSCQKEGK